jgi:4a-hydroxytetrahydrobiopterin dehydratase
VERLGNQQVLAEGLVDWRKLAQALHARFLSSDYLASAGFVSAVAELAQAEDHYPDLRLAAGIVEVSLCTRVDGLWVTQKDVDMARTISEIARDLGLEADPAAVTQLEIALDTAHEDHLSPFWSILLTGSADNKIHDSVFDPSGRVPSLWFQTTDEHDAPRQRWHFDLWLAPEVADGRIVAAVASGGSIVDGSGAPSFTVLADTDGNRVCVCTATGR